MEIQMATACIPTTRDDPGEPSSFITIDCPGLEDFIDDPPEMRTELRRRLIELFDEIYDDHFALQFEDEETLTDPAA